MFGYLQITNKICYLVTSPGYMLGQYAAAGTGPERSTMKYFDDDQKELIRHAVIGYQLKLLAHQSAIEDIQARLAELLPPVPAEIEITTPRRRGRPPKALLTAAAGKPVKSGWSSDPAERSREMK